MSLLDSLKFHISFAIANIPVFLRILAFLAFSLLYKALGIDPVAKKTFFSVDSLPSPKLTGLGRGRKPCPYANMSADLGGEPKDAHPHEYRAPGPNDRRSPCPALNTMANHGYIPRDGKNLTGTNLTHGLIQCYNLSWPLAAFLAWGGVLLLGQVGELSLYDLSRHNRIEHDASLTHPNTPQGEEYAPRHSSPDLWKSFLKDARNDKFRAADIARARIRREREPGTEVTAVQQEIARGEVALVLQIFGGRKFTVPVDVVRRWWGEEERLPEGWRPTRKTTLIGTVYWATQIRHAMDEMRDEKVIGEEKRVVFDEREKLLEKRVAAAVIINGNAKTNGYATNPVSSTATPPNVNGSLPPRTPSPTRQHTYPVVAAAA